MVGIDLRKHYGEVLQDKKVLLKRIRGLKYTPYVNNADLVDVIKILKAIPALEIFQHLSYSKCRGFPRKAR